MNKNNFIKICGVKENNLKNLNIDIPRDKLVVITGVSGSGKSSLAFDTIYAEGRRLYLESLSNYAKQFESNSKPNVESISGLLSAIAIDQKTTMRNPRSTVATVTEIYDYMRVLFSRIGTPYSPATGLPIKKQTTAEIVSRIMSIAPGTSLQFYAPVVNGRKGEYRKEIISLRRQGHKSVRIDGVEYGFDNLPMLEKNKRHVIDAILSKVVIQHTSESEATVSDIVNNALRISDGIVVLEVKAIPKKLDNQTDNVAKDIASNIQNENNLGMNLQKVIEQNQLKVGDVLTFSQKFACPVSGFSMPEIEPRIFSFNSPYGACPKCDGLGVESFFSPDLVMPCYNISIKDGAIVPWNGEDEKFSSVTKRNFYNQTLNGLAAHYGFSLDTKLVDLPKEIINVLLYGSDDLITFNYFDSHRKVTTKTKFGGILNYLQDRWVKAENQNTTEDLNKYRDVRNCTSCNGYRLREESLCIKIDNLHVGQVCSMSINELIGWFSVLPAKLSPIFAHVSDQAIKEISKRLKLLDNIGLGYLTLNRRSVTLSGGESQRIRLATQIGSGLSGVLYVLDEPSIGLHQSDNTKLMNTMRLLCDQGNSVIVVEHDIDMMRSADYLIDIGPGAGVNGGQLVAAGTPEEVAANPNSITGQYLRNTRKIELPKSRRPIGNKSIKVIGAEENNLRNIDVSIPLGNFVVVTGVSGSGKSTFVIDTLYKAAIRKMNGSQVTPGAHKEIFGLEYIDKIIEVDQSAIGRTPRSNPATYTNVFTIIRDWFAALPEAKNRGYTASRFSFNVKSGRCEVCEGDGAIKIEMYFLPDVYVPCEQCNGKRYNEETLQITYEGRSIADVLKMTTDDALAFFDGTSNLIKEKLMALHEVGLGYIQIGQSATTLSGGEAQRVKLAKELARKSTGRTLYIFDEPTTGLHIEDIRKLLLVLNKLVDYGNSVLVIEHNLDVIKMADHVIDFGPYGGDKGGEVVVYGTPEEIIKCPESLTGHYLKPYL